MCQIHLTRWMKEQGKPYQRFIRAYQTSQWIIMSFSSTIHFYNVHFCIVHTNCAVKYAKCLINNAQHNNEFGTPFNQVFTAFPLSTKGCYSYTELTHDLVFHKGESSPDWANQTHIYLIFYISFYYCYILSTMLKKYLRCCDGYKHTWQYKTQWAQRKQQQQNTGCVSNLKVDELSWQEVYF